MTDNIYGPTLPPHLQKKNDTFKESESVVGPPHPQLETDNHHESSDDEVYGPVLPLTLTSNQNKSKALTSSCDKSNTVIGPAIPLHLRQKLSEQSDKILNDISTDKLEDASSDEDDTYGPLPVGASSNSKAYTALEERALQMKLDKLGPSDAKNPVREEWMLELPELHTASLGVGPRQFRKSARPDMSNRSSWTDTPNKKVDKSSPKIDLKKETLMKEIAKRDKEHEKVIKEHNKKKKRDKSLLEMHQEDMKKKKTDEEGSSVRRPFNRETDLQVNRFDDAQKKAIFKKAQFLDDRFSRGEAKYL